LSSATVIVDRPAASKTSGATDIIKVATANPCITSRSATRRSLEVVKTRPRELKLCFSTKRTKSQDTNVTQANVKAVAAARSKGLREGGSIPSTALRSGSTSRTGRTTPNKAAMKANARRPARRRGLDSSIYWSYQNESWKASAAATRRNEC